MSDTPHQPPSISEPGLPPGLPEALLDYLPIGIAVIDRTFILRHYNSTWINLITQYAPAQVGQVRPGVAIFDLIPGSEAIFAPLFERVLAGETISQEVLRLQNGDKVVYWNILLTPFPQDEQSVSIVGAVNDITKWMLAHGEPEIRAVTGLNDAAMLSDNIDLYERSRDLAVLEERNRLAQELHDNLAQAVGYLSLQLGTTSQLFSNQQTDQAQAKLRELRQLVNEIYTDVREEIFNLRSQMSLTAGFLETLRQYIAKYKRHYDLDIRLSLEVSQDRLELPTEMGIQLIRIIQEALINVRKHSGVDQAVIRLKDERGNLRLSVEDRGQGFDPEQIDQAGQTGFGLQIMAERAESIGGELELDTLPGGGVRVVIWLPF